MRQQCTQSNCKVPYIVCTVCTRIYSRRISESISNLFLARLHRRRRRRQRHLLEVVRRVHIRIVFRLLAVVIHVQVVRTMRPCKESTELHCMHTLYTFVYIILLTALLLIVGIHTRNRRYSFRKFILWSIISFRLGKK